VLCRILALEKLGAVFNQVATPLQFTPRRFVIHAESSNLIVIETDHNAYTDNFKQAADGRGRSLGVPTGPEKVLKFYAEI